MADLDDVRRIALGFPKEARESLVAAEPEKFLMPARCDLRYNWVRLRLARVDVAELEELLVDAWRMCVPKGVAAEFLANSQ